MVGLKNAILERGVRDMKAKVPTGYLAVQVVNHSSFKLTKLAVSPKILPVCILTSLPPPISKMQYKGRASQTLKKLLLSHDSAFGFRILALFILLFISAVVLNQPSSASSFLSADIRSSKH